MIGTWIRERTGGAERREVLFENLMRKTHRQAYSFAVKLTGNAAEAEDLVQETFVRAFRFFHRYDDTLPFTNWLYRIMSNAHIDTVRRRHRLKTASLEQPTEQGTSTLDIVDPSRSAENTMVDCAMGEHVEDALAHMTPEFRTAVLLADVEGMAYEEIADIMRTSVGTVRSRIHRGRKQLRKHLVRSAPEVYGGMTDEL
jgi:RNA polymerase sigma-70 factor (ECF subfamily)